jgi:pimeloyl-ACP methyl ester carboxylesterase
MRRDCFADATASARRATGAKINNRGSTDGSNSTKGAASAGGAHVAVEVKRHAGIDAVEQLTRYLELLNRDALLAPVHGVLAAQTIRPQARTLLAHGAWADGSSWSAVIQRLHAGGYHVTAPQFPETSLADDVARLRQVLDRQDGPTVLAGHSYGGQIMTALGTDAPNVAGLVYIAAFGLDEGESIGGLLAQAARRPPRWPISTSTSSVSPGCRKRTSCTTSPATSIRSRPGSYTRCSSRWPPPRCRT